MVELASTDLSEGQKNWRDSNSGSCRHHHHSCLCELQQRSVQGGRPGGMSNGGGGVPHLLLP